METTPKEEGMTKNEQFIAYIISKYPNPGVTALTKLAYLIDLMAVQKSGKQISSFNYVRWNFGPFDKNIYGVLGALQEKQVIFPYVSPVDPEKEFYGLTPDRECEIITALSEKEIAIIEKVCLDLSGVGVRVLTTIAYDTKPMKALGVTLGDGQKMGVQLNLNAKKEN